MRFFTFSWGRNHIVIRGLLRALGHELATPPDVSCDTIEKGVAIAHPFLCYSGKVVVGQIFAQLQAGLRNFIFMSSLSAEACRCADTALYMEWLFKDRYPDLRVVRLGGNDRQESFANMRHYFPSVTLHQHDHAYLIFHMKLEILHMIDKTCLKLRALAQDSSRVRKMEAKFIHLLDRYNRPSILYFTGMRFHWEAKRIRLKEEAPSIRIGIVGGEHILSELDFVMGRIKKLAEEGIYLEWRSGFRFMARAANREAPLQGKEGLPYMKALAEGYLHPAPMTSEIFSCAHALEFAREGFDGLVHIYAMGCMPQTALKPALHKIAEDTRLPILALALGDKFNETGIENRLDAFIDLLRQKRAQRCPVPING
jgi:hypothetical protein